MLMRRSTKGRLIRPETPELIAGAMTRFLKFCRFEATTGCVLWAGGVRSGRGHNVLYPNFWFNGVNWHGHRWSAKYIHGLDIDNFHVDHFCPNIPLPNTMCVEHVQTLTPKENRDLQTSRRRHYIHLQVGLIDYEEVYGAAPDPSELENMIPFYEPPSWLALPKGPPDGNCPF